MKKNSDYYRFLKPRNPNNTQSIHQVFDFIYLWAKVTAQVYQMLRDIGIYIRIWMHLELIRIDFLFFGVYFSFLSKLSRGSVVTKIYNSTIYVMESMVKTLQFILWEKIAKRLRDGRIRVRKMVKMQHNARIRNDLVSFHKECGVSIWSIRKTPKNTQCSQ